MNDSNILSYGDAVEGQVWFGVGTFGTSDDEMMGLGNCYRYHYLQNIFK